MSILGRYEDGLRGRVCVTPDGTVGRVQKWTHARVMVHGRWHGTAESAVLADEAFLDVLPAVLRALGWHERDVPYIMDEVRDCLIVRQLVLFDFEEVG